MQQWLTQSDYIKTVYCDGWCRLEEDIEITKDINQCRFLVVSVLVIIVSDTVDRNVESVELD